MRSIIPLFRRLPSYLSDVDGRNPLLLSPYSAVCSSLHTFPATSFPPFLPHLVSPHLHPLILLQTVSNSVERQEQWGSEINRLSAVNILITLSLCLCVCVFSVVPFCFPLCLPCWFVFSVFDQPWSLFSFFLVVK